MPTGLPAGPSTATPPGCGARTARRPAESPGRVRVNATLARPTDAAEQRGDATLAHRELGWSPTVGFTEIVARMVEADLALLR